MSLNARRSNNMDGATHRNPPPQTDNSVPTVDAAAVVALLDALFGSTSGTSPLVKEIEPADDGDHRTQIEGRLLTDGAGPQVE